jgi:hypothetical protein
VARDFENIYIEALPLFMKTTTIDNFIPENALF